MMRVTKKSVQLALDTCRRFPKTMLAPIGVLAAYIKRADAQIDQLHLQLKQLSQGALFAQEATEISNGRSPILPPKDPPRPSLGRKERFRTAWTSGDTKTVEAMSKFAGQELCEQWLKELDNPPYSD